ncbi:MAG: DUF72 domain-containing protein [Thermoplasmatales archaeon]|nr:DUF72 domain-containing protein [Candidatus Thermoplasmatota archaeon]MCL6002883.1 DUF72 domain-containing protein [Candidatus Thermoplasmatota archaeon]MDA8056277.1 DUF72 domain-containing protein [Thermoplasmatales archaeon]
MLYLGCSGFQYTDWKESFYPKGMEENKYLMYYYKFFNSVEIDSTYYSFPGEKTVNSWISKIQGKEDFVYSLKFPREVTHDPEGITEKSIEVARSFVSKVILPIKSSGFLGSALLQLSPFVDPVKDGQVLGRLEDLFSSVYSTYRLSVEIRNKNFLDNSVLPAFLNILKKFNIALVSVDSPGLPYFYYPTASFSYIRFHGRNYDLWYGKGDLKGRLNKYDYLYSEEELKPWVDRVRGMGDEIFIYFNNHAQAKAAVNAAEFQKLLGIKIVRKESQTNLNAF